MAKEKSKPSEKKELKKFFFPEHGVIQAETQEKAQAILDERLGLGGNETKKATKGNK
jgi:hypothetical protein